jgi:hypothetical protein
MINNNQDSDIVDVGKDVSGEEEELTSGRSEEEYEEYEEPKQLGCSDCGATGYNLVGCSGDACSDDYNFLCMKQCAMACSTCAHTWRGKNKPYYCGFCAPRHMVMLRCGTCLKYCCQKHFWTKHRASCSKCKECYTEDQKYDPNRWIQPAKK